MKLYQYHEIDELNQALAAFNARRIKVISVRPHYYESPPPPTARGLFSGKNCFYVMTDEWYEIPKQEPSN